MPLLENRLGLMSLSLVPLRLALQREDKTPPNRCEQKSAGILKTIKQPRQQSPSGRFPDSAHDRLGVLLLNPLIPLHVD